MLVAEYGSSALDLLQSYIDSLVELGRMDDNRLGLHFFQEIKANIELQSHKEDDNVPQPPAKKKKSSQSPTPSSGTAAIGSLSLQNANFMDETLSSMLQSNVLSHIAVLDLTGVSTLTDDMLQQICCASGSQLQRLSVKNCRRLTNVSMTNLTKHCSNLISIDLGGAYNISPEYVLDTLSPLQTITNNANDGNSHLSELLELHASGLGWNDGHLKTLFSLRAWRALSVGFSPLLTFAGWKEAVWADSSEGMCNRLQSLAVPFCEGLVDNAWLGMMGRHVPHLRALDVRGNTGLNSMTGWYDGRATIVPSVPLQQSLVVLARYSNLTKSSVEDTKRVHPVAALPLTVELDSGGVGLGILRLDHTAASTRATIVSSLERKRSTPCGFSAPASTAKTKTSSSPVFSACDLDTDKPSSCHQTSLLSFFAKKTNTLRKVVTFNRINGGSHDEGQSIAALICPHKTATPPIVKPPIITASSYPEPFVNKKALTQVYIDCGQSKFGQTLCDKCGMLYTPGLQEDEKQHSQMCQAICTGIACSNVNKIGKVVERVASRTNRQYSVVLWRSTKNAHIPSHLPLLAHMIAKDLGMDEGTTLQHLKEQTMFLYIGNRAGSANVKKNGGNILGVATAQSISKAFTMSSLHERSLTPSKAMLGIGILWTHPSARHQGIATILVNAVRDHTVFGMRVEKSMMAFSSPTQAGYAFAMNYLYGSKSNERNWGKKDNREVENESPIGPLVYEM
ncbi:ESCO1/2 acetyl-transferase [Nitzschia inconspicua]|uniref:ESCO1/2 acetyl-transferase n=1 Tax=Nitzschia inconspicua TaxID=303405 RepID=A0A9K3LNQ1_9STRA|nr:ESCO1/2 acetyl-transferase [Nitzschia inconspicua]